MQALGPTTMLALWERGAARHALDRAALLCAWARPDLPADSIVDLPLGTVTEALLQLRETSFGARMAIRADCGHCGAALELSLGCTELLQAAMPTAEAEAQVLGLRPPSLRDLAAVAAEADAGRAARQLLARCMAPGPADAQALSDEDFQACEEALDALDPNADIAFELHCEACGERGSAQLDAAALLWEEIEARAQALLWEVHTLARAYGWTEAQTLSLGNTRRQRYLAMAGAS